MDAADPAWATVSRRARPTPEGDHATSLTRERWLLPLFSGARIRPAHQQPGVEIDGKRYPVFCEYNHSPIHLVGAGVPLDRRTPGVAGAATSPAQPGTGAAEPLRRAALGLRQQRPRRCVFSATTSALPARHMSSSISRRCSTARSTRTSRCSGSVPPVTGRRRDAREVLARAVDSSRATRRHTRT